MLRLQIADWRLWIDCRLRIDCRLLTGDPVVGGRQYLFRRALHDLEVGAAAEHAVVVDLEAAVQAEPRVEHERADEGARPIAGGLERGGERGRRIAESEGAVVAHAVPRRVARRHQRRVRRQRERHVRVRAIEAKAFVGDGVDVGRDARRRCRTRRRDRPAGCRSSRAARWRRGANRPAAAGWAACDCAGSARRPGPRRPAPRRSPPGRVASSRHRRARASAACTAGMSRAYRSRGASRRKRSRYGAASARRRLSASVMPRLKSRS